jgi:hypothetical protein
MLLLIRPKMVSTLRAEDAVADEAVAERAAAALKEEKGEAGKCWICNSSSHQRAECPVWIKGMMFAKKETGGDSAPYRQTGSGGGGSSRGRANYRGRSSSSRGPSLSTLASTSTPLRREAHSPVPEGEDQWGSRKKLDGPGLARPAEGPATTAETLPSAGLVRSQLSESADSPPPQQQQQPTWSDRHLSHILRMSESTKAPKPKNSGPYKYFVPMSIGGVICKAMVYSGNLWKNVLSLDFLHKLGLTGDDLREVPEIQEVGTAKSGTGLKVVGELKTPIHLRFGGCATRFKCRPVILEGLSMLLNVSGPFLAQFRINRLHSEGALLVQG